jgi:toxin YoeB
VTWTLVYSKHAQKDAQKLARAGLKPKAEALLAILREDPYRQPPPCKPLVGDLAGAWSRRINIQHRLVYEVDEDRHIVKVLRMWSHYGD